MEYRYRRIGEFLLWEWKQLEKEGGRGNIKWIGLLEIIEGYVIDEEKEL